MQQLSLWPVLGREKGSVVLLVGLSWAILEVPTIPGTGSLWLDNCHAVRAGQSPVWCIDAVHRFLFPGPLASLRSPLPHLTNYQMTPSKRGAGGGSATHKEPT